MGANPLFASEFAATLLQGAITTGLAALCWQLYRRYRRPWFKWFAVAWSVYVLRLACIASFLVTDQYAWLYWHQVATGWTALILLWASLVFSRQPRRQTWHVLLLLFPPVWSYIAIYQLEHFLWAALPSVLFLSFATAWTGWVFWQYHRVASSIGARLLSIAFGLWALHHLDYPFLRAQGAWTPWGYYLDICFELLVGAGVVLLVLDDLGRGVRALSALSGDLQRRRGERELLDGLLQRPLTLPGVRGSAMFEFEEPGATGAQAPTVELETERAPNAAGRFTLGTGACADWADRAPPDEVRFALSRLHASGAPQVAVATGDQPYVTALPVTREHRVVAALVMASDVRNPFTALDDAFLRALGQQVGASLEQADLDRQLAERTDDLERLSARMVRQHEEERRRLSRELHDETAQVFSAVKMQLEALRPNLGSAQAPRLDRLLQLVDTGIASIRSVTNDLRPSMLDDLGLVPALRSLVHEVSERAGLHVTLDAEAAIPPLSPDTELALFRALQEALSNVVRHADASATLVSLDVRDGAVRLRVRDDGRGLPVDARGQVRSDHGRMGLTGMRERIHAVGGTVRLRNVSPGVEVEVLVPLPAQQRIA
jgi:signal transduction histidine kinase